MLGRIFGRAKDHERSWQTSTCRLGLRRTTPGTRSLSVYVATLLGALYVLHAFQKKSKQTTLRDIEAARARLKALGAR